MPAATLILTQGDVRRLLGPDDCIAAVEAAFRRHGEGTAPPPALAGVHAGPGGFHLKAALLELSRPYFAAKINANFPANPTARGLPTIQGAIALFSGEDGRVLALLDSIEITAQRTAAATAVAARHLARPAPSAVTLCGCGAQGKDQLRALARVRTLTRVFAYDLDPARARALAGAAAPELGLPVAVVRSLEEGTAQSDIVITCTPARRWFLGRAHVRPGTFIAAVGADHESKQEIEQELMAEHTVVADILEQAATIGDLHHALAAGLMTRAEIHAELGEIVAGKKPGRRTEQEIIVFDSTGTALQDVAAAALVYERALDSGAGLPVKLDA